MIDNGTEPDVPESLAAQNKSAKPVNKNRSEQQNSAAAKSKSASTKFYDEYKEAVTQSGAHYEKAQAGTKYDIGGGALLDGARADRAVVYERPDEDGRQFAECEFDCDAAGLRRLLDAADRAMLKNKPNIAC